MIIKENLMRKSLLCLIYPAKKVRKCPDFFKTMNKIIVLVLSLLICSGAELMAQTTLPLIQNENGGRSNTSAAEREKKLKKAREVYDRLVSARGDTRYLVPALTLEPTEQNGAIMYYSVPEIMLEEKAFDVCASFGPDMDAALAIILGHELTHYYEKHGWRRGFVEDYKDLKIKMKLDELQEKIGYETQADYIGGFLAYTAGYGIFDKGPHLIDAIYEKYHLHDSLMPNYPRREDRKTLSERTAKRVEALIEVFEMANMLAIVGLYPEARQYYHYVLKEYQSREIYNNIGVLTIMEALGYFKEGEFKYQLPLELDLESSVSERLGPTEIEIREKLLKEALRNFDAAISLDPDYAPAYLNKACAYALLGDAPRAQFYAEIEAIQCATKNGRPETASDAKVLLGILAAIRGDKASAQKILEAEVAQKNPLAETNLKLLLGTPTATTTRPEKDETIDGIDLYEYKDNPSSILDIKIAPGLTFFQDLPPGSASKIFMTSREGSRPSIFFHIIEPKYAGKSGRKIARGDDRSAIENEYGAPQKIIKTPRGAILRYGKVIFILGADGKVQRWVNYFKP